MRAWGRERLDVAGLAQTVGLALVAALTLALVYLAFEADDPPAGGFAVDDERVPATAEERPEGRTYALWLGDSFAAGTGAPDDDPGRGYAILAGVEMGWNVDLDALSGTGFYNDGVDVDADNAALGDRLEEAAAKWPGNQVVVVDAGRYDSRFARDDVVPAIEQFFPDLHEAYPEARIVVVLPFIMTSADPSWVNPVIEAAAEAVDADVIDPIGAGWIGPGKPDRLVDEDEAHPSARGHRYVARHLVRELRRLDLPGKKA